MEVEYISLDPPQQTYCKKNLLYSEMELLNTIKKYKKYKKLRKEGQALKSLLKRTIKELKEELKKFDQKLPKTHHSKFGPVEINRAQRQRNDLEEEINEIKRRIAELQ